MTYFCLSMDFISIFQILGESSWENVFPQSSLFTYSLSVPALPCHAYSPACSLSSQHLLLCSRAERSRNPPETETSRSSFHKLAPARKSNAATSETCSCSRFQCGDRVASFRKSNGIIFLIERKVKKKKQNISGTFIPGLIVCTKNKKKKSKSKYNREKCPISIEERKKC